MKLREFADMITDREYGHEITTEEEALAKELGFVVVFGYSDNNAELRGAIDDEIGCFDGGVLEHKDLQGTILAEWCPEDIECSWHFSSTQPSEKFYIFTGEELYCVGIVIDNNNKPKTNADRIRAMRDEQLAEFIGRVKEPCDYCQLATVMGACTESLCDDAMLKWLKHPVEEDEDA